MGHLLLQLLLQLLQLVCCRVELAHLEWEGRSPNPQWAAPTRTETFRRRLQQVIPLRWCASSSPRSAVFFFLDACLIVLHLLYGVVSLLFMLCYVLLY